MVVPIASQPHTDVLDALKQSKKPATAELDAKKLGDDYAIFLKLLTTQLQHQDPTEPLDTNEFTQQIVAFSNVEQAVNANKNLEKLIALSAGAQVNNAVNYIGKLIRSQGNEGWLENGRATFLYELPEEAGQATVTITDPRGKVVFTGDAGKKAGLNELTWDGTNSLTGQRMPAGPYKIVVSAKGLSGNELQPKTFTSGRVTSVDLQDGDASLSIGTIAVPLDKVLSIHEAPRS